MPRKTSSNGIETDNPRGRKTTSFENLFGGSLFMGQNQKPPADERRHYDSDSRQQGEENSARTRAERCEKRRSILKKEKHVHFEDEIDPPYRETRAENNENYHGSTKRHQPPEECRSWNASRTRGTSRAAEVPRERTSRHTENSSRDKRSPNFSEDFRRREPNLGQSRQYSGRNTDFNSSGAFRPSESYSDRHHHQGPGHSARPRHDAEQESHGQRSYSHHFDRAGYSTGPHKHAGEHYRQPESSSSHDHGDGHGTRPGQDSGQQSRERTEPPHEEFAGDSSSRSPLPVPRLPDYYSILGVSRFASYTEIKKVAKEKRIETHPDRLTHKPGLSEEERKSIEERAKEVGEAADFLLDEKKRYWYDQELIKQRI